MVHDPCNDPPLPKVVPLQHMTRAVQDLQPNTRYTLRLRTVSRFNVPSDWSEAIDFTTPNTSYKPAISRPLLYEGHTSMNVRSNESILAQFTDGDLTAWPKENIVSEDNIHYSSLFHAPGSLRLDWKWSGRSGPWPTNEEPYLSAIIELRDKSTLLLVDKWEIPMQIVGGITVPMHFSPDYEWRLNVNGPQGLTNPFLASFNARVRLQGVETTLWDLIFKSSLPEEEEDFECPDLEHTEWVIKKSATSPPEYYVSGGGFGPTSTSNAPAPDMPSPTHLPRGGPLTPAGYHQWYAPAHHQWGLGQGQASRWLLDFGNGSYDWLYYVGRHPKTGGGNPHLYNHPWNTWGDDCIVRNQFTVQDGFATFSLPSIVAGSSPWEKFETQYVFPGRAMLDRNNHSRDHGISVGPTLKDAERPVHHGTLEPYVKTRITDEFRDVPRWRFNEDIGASGPGEPFISITEEAFGQYNLRTEWTTACNISDGWSAYISLFRPPGPSENSRIFLRAISPNHFPGLNDPATLEIDTTKYHPYFRAVWLNNSAIYKIKDGTIFLVLEEWVWDDDLNIGGDVLIYVQFDWTGTEWIEVGYKQVTNVESEFSWQTLSTQNIDGVLYMTFQEFGFYNGDWFPTEIVARMPLIGEGEPSYVITMRESWGGEAQRLVWVDNSSINLATYNFADNIDVHPGITILPIEINPDGSMVAKKDQQWVIETEEFNGWSDVYMVSFARSLIIFGRLDSPEIGVQDDEFAWQVVCCGTEEESQASDPFIAELQTEEGDEFRIWTDSIHPPIIPAEKVGDYLVINKHIDANPNASSQIDGGPYTRGTRAYTHNSNSFVMMELGIRTISIKLPESFKKMS